ncbi:hypothetical protein GCM10027269_14830 [Kribbella endophytica]
MPGSATGIRANAVHPGAIATNLQQHTGGLQTPVERRKTVQQGAATSVFAAVAEVGGRYFEDCGEAAVAAERPPLFGGGVAPWTRATRAACESWASAWLLQSEHVRAPEQLVARLLDGPFCCALTGRLDRGGRSCFSSSGRPRTHRGSSWHSLPDVPGPV